MGRLYKLYALLEYQAERGVLDKVFQKPICLHSLIT